MIKRFYSEKLLSDKHDETYFGLQSFSDPSEAWYVMSANWGGDSVPKEEKEIAILGLSVKKRPEIGVQSV